MKTIAIVAILLFGGGCATSHRYTIPLSAAADVASTEHAISQGRVEANPFPWAKTTGSRIAISILGSSLAVWYIEELHEAGHHGWAKAFEVVLVGYKGSLAAYNFKEATK